MTPACRCGRRAGGQGCAEHRLPGTRRRVWPSVAMAPSCTSPAKGLPVWFASRRPPTGVTGQIAVGHTPGAPVLSPDGSRLYVSNRFNNNVSVIDLATAKRSSVSRRSASPSPPRSARTVRPCSSAICCRSTRQIRTTWRPKITVIDTASLTTSNIRLLNGSSSVFGICVSPDGKYAYVAHILSRYQMPTTQLERGWMNTNALSILDVAEKSLINTVLLDDIDLGAANPHAVTTTADGKTILVTHSGTHEVSAIDAEGLHEKLASIPKTMEEAKATGRYDGRGTYSSVTVNDVPNDLAFLVDLRRRITLRRGGHWGMIKTKVRWSMGRAAWM
jgi:hypothetical protein